MLIDYKILVKKEGKYRKNNASYPRFHKCDLYFRAYYNYKRYSERK